MSFVYIYHNLETESESGSVVSDSLQPHIVHGILQYSWASLVAQMVQNLPAVWETQV